MMPLSIRGRSFFELILNALAQIACLRLRSRHDAAPIRVIGFFLVEPNVLAQVACLRLRSLVEASSRGHEASLKTKLDANCLWTQSTACLRLRSLVEALRRGHRAGLKTKLGANCLWIQFTGQQGAGSACAFCFAGLFSLEKRDMNIL